MKICEDDQKCWWRLATIKKENAGGEIVNFLFLKQYNITLLLICSIHAFTGNWTPRSLVQFQVNAWTEQMLGLKAM